LHEEWRVHPSFVDKRTTANPAFITRKLLRACLISAQSSSLLKLHSTNKVVSAGPVRSKNKPVPRRDANRSHTVAYSRGCRRDEVANKSKCSGAPKLLSESKPIVRLQRWGRCLTAKLQFSGKVLAALRYTASEDVINPLTPGRKRLINQLDEYSRVTV